MAGAAIAWGGLGLRWWSQNELGRLFTFEVGIRKGHKLVQSGPYAMLRHPSYTGLAVGLAGIALFLRCAAAPALSVFLRAGHTLRWGTGVSLCRFWPMPAYWALCFSMVSAALGALVVSWLRRA